VEEEVQQQQQQQDAVDPSGLEPVARMVGQFHPGIETELGEVVNTAINGCCCMEKIIQCVIITFMFFCFILALNILFTIARGFRQAS
jgi:hypothetical protein